MKFEIYFLPSAFYLVCLTSPLFAFVRFFCSSSFTGPIYSTRLNYFDSADEIFVRPNPRIWVPCTPAQTAAAPDPVHLPSCRQLRDVLGIALGS